MARLTKRRKEKTEGPYKYAHRFVSLKQKFTLE
jgi:hypothetical protein